MYRTAWNSVIWGEGTELEVLSHPGFGLTYHVPLHREREHLSWVWKTLAPSWSLAQQNWLGFLGLTGIFKTCILKTFQTFRYLLCSFAFLMLRDKWWFGHGLAEKLQQRLFLHSPCREVSGGLWFLWNFQIAARSTVDLILFSVWFEKYNVFQLSLVHLFLIWNI